MNENKLTKRIEELFADGQITLAIGYEMGTSGPRPFFCRSAQDASRMVFSNDFPNNLAVYLTKKGSRGRRKSSCCRYSFSFEEHSVPFPAKTRWAKTSSRYCIFRRMTN